MTIPSLLLSALLLTTHAANAPLRVRPGMEGDLYAWLVAGPYPNPGGEEAKGKGFAVDYLGGEGQVAPVEGAKNGEFTWTLATGDRVGGVDLTKAIGDRGKPAIGYLYTSLVSPQATNATLLFGSDDGAKVFLNGEKIFERQLMRGVNRDEERVPIHLRQGTNRLLVKVEQGARGWGFSGRVVGANGEPIPGLIEEVTIDRDASTLGTVRRFAGTAGSLDLEGAERYRRISSLASRWAQRFQKEAVDPERLRRVLNEQATHVEGASTAEAYSSAVNEGRQAVQADYDRARKPLLVWAQRPGPLVPDANPKREDFVRVMPGGRYFVHADGRSLIPIGANHNPDWAEFEQENPLADDYEPGRADRWFKRLADHGINLIRLMVETPPSGNLEERPGVFRPEHVKWLDAIFLAAYKHNVKLMVTPYDTFWMNLRADASPYWKMNGGPIDPANKSAFLTDPKIFDLQKNRMRWLIDRYGNLGTVFCWEIMNEIDLWWGASPEQIRSWTDRMAAFTRDYQRRRWGRDHLITESFAEPMTKGLNADTQYRDPGLDFATAHLYVGITKAPGPNDAVAAGEAFATGVRHAEGEIRDGRPFFDGESGPIDRWITDPKLDNEVFHQMSWAHLLAGGAGPGTRWPYRNPHHISEGMMNTLKAMRTFCDGVDWNRLTGTRVAVDTSAPARLLATDRGAIAWLQGAKGIVAFKWPDARPARIRVYDIRGGRWVGRTTTSQDKDGVAVQLPDSVSEVAVWIER